jgi:RNAse (barnase) inhibitor barstar
VISVEGLVDGSLTPGVYRVLGRPDAIVQVLEEAGWQPVVLAPGASTGDFYDQLASALRLPDWFGRNLDALWDVLTDLSAPTALVLTDWTRLPRARPDRWASIMATLTERTLIAPAFAVVLA